MYLTNFQILRPDFEKDQEALLDWIVQAHTRAQARLNNWDLEKNQAIAFREELQERLYKIGLGEKKIQKRGYILPDCTHEHWEKMAIYNLEKNPQGEMLRGRMEHFDRACTEILQRFYADSSPLPNHLIHVTCTGYVAPSPAQKLVSIKRATSQTLVTHAYHMGCYGAIPSIRIGMGHLAIKKTLTDIVHTEVASIHMNPSLHSNEQLVVQSLFADGFIKYSVNGHRDGFSLEILSIDEAILESSKDKMTWNLTEYSFEMTLSREIPLLIRRNLKCFLEDLSEQSGGINWKNARFAIHPGGPKIIEQIADHLNLNEGQIEHSKEILSNCGNMSSATLPHVWEKMVGDPTVEVGEAIVSLAFGPGLTIAGGIFIKR